MNNNGTSLLGVLGIAFVVLKLTGFIDWSWWYVTLPFWGGLAVALVVIAVIFLIDALRPKKNKKEVVPKRSKLEERIEMLKRQKEGKL